MSKRSSSESLTPLPGLTVDDIARMSDAKTFQRGERYWRDGAVGSIVEDRGRVMTTVRGTRRYRVELWLRDGELEYSCTCPVGGEGDFCKHCVATALACIDAQTSSESRTSRTPVASTASLAEGLSRVSKEDLVSLLVERAVKDESLCAAIGRLIDRASGKRIDTAPYRRIIDRAMKLDDHGYDESRDPTEAMREMIETIGEALTDAESAATMIPLVEHAVTGGEKLLAMSDDSNGDISGAIHDLADLHRKACKLARPDPTSLAERLFMLASQGESEAFLDAYSEYAGILGKVGRARFREIAEREWSKVKRVRASDGFRFDRDRTVLTLIMESIGKEDRDPDLLISVMKKNLTDPLQYVAIAEVLLNAERDDEALEWAQRGAGKFRADPDPHLTGFLIQQYMQRGMKQEALEEAWHLFAAQPHVESFRLLKKQAELLSTWKEWRARAVELLDDLSHKAGSGKNIHSPYLDPPSTMVEILLDDGDSDGAWRAAITYGCEDDLWVRLAEVRAASHPEDALAVYRAQIEEATGTASRRWYVWIVEMLGRMEKIMRGEGRSEEFAEEVRQLRERWKQRRTFVAMLDEKFPQKRSGSAVTPSPPPPKPRRG